VLLFFKPGSFRSADIFPELIGFSELKSLVAFDVRVTEQLAFSAL